LKRIKWRKAGVGRDNCFLSFCFASGCGLHDRVRSGTDHPQALALATKKEHSASCGVVPFGAK